MAKQNTHLTTWSSVHWRKFTDIGSIVGNPLLTIIYLANQKLNSGTVISNNEVYTFYVAQMGSTHHSLLLCCDQELVASGYPGKVVVEFATSPYFLA